MAENDYIPTYKRSSAASVLLLRVDMNSVSYNMSLPNLFACGSNGSSQLALNHAEDVSVLTRCTFHPSLEFNSTEIINLVSASTHSLLLLRTDVGNVLLGAGTNTLGQLGPRCALWDEVKPEERFKALVLAKDAGLQGEWTPVDVCATWTSSFVVYQQLETVSSGSGSSAAPLRSADTSADRPGRQVIIACGSNDFGELGIPSSSDKVAITRPSDNPIVVDVEIRPGETVQKIKGGQRHVVVLLSGPKGQRVVGWGASRKGELDPTSYGKTRSAKGKTSYPASSPPTDIRLDLPPGVVVEDFALGASHTVLLLSNGTVRAWGGDLKGQITGLNDLKGVSGIGATWGGTYCLMQDGTVLSQGSNTHSQLVRSTEGGRASIDVDAALQVRKIVAGSEHLLLVGGQAEEDAGLKETLFAGGWNEHGNLGLGDQLDRPTLHRVHIPMHGRIRGVWGGLAATWLCIGQ